MRYWLLAIIALAASFTAGLGQAPSRSDDLTSSTLRLTRAISETAVNDIYEDIEIMRRLLARKLAGRDGMTGAGTVSYPYFLNYLNQANPNQQSQNLDSNQRFAPTINQSGASTGFGGPVEGVYLGGKGVIFTVTMSTGNREVMPTKGVAAPAVTSEWERARQALHGENPEPTTKPDPVQPSIADVVLKVLAENGKHIRVRDDEDVTVVVTLRNENPTAQTWWTPTQARPFTTIDVSTSVAPVTEQAPASPIAPLAGGHGKTARDFELLGDLHLRQKQYQQATEAFQRAINLQPDDPKQLAENFRKLAEAKLQLGQLNEAKAMIESAVEWERKSKQPAGTAAPKTENKPKPESSWPAKLLIAANKRQLDAVGSGKMTLEEFRQKAAVELVSPKSTNK